MKKKLSIREVYLFLILLVLLVFLYINKGPLTTSKETAQNQQYSIQNSISALQPQITQKNNWQAAIDKAYLEAGGNPKSIPDYNNINVIIAEMSMIFDGDSTYSISFGDPSVNGFIATRNIRISFSCANYSEMIQKLVEINNSDNRYRITDLSLSGSVGENANLEGNYSVSLGLISYEYYKENK